MVNTVTGVRFIAINDVTNDGQFGNKVRLKSVIKYSLNEYWSSMQNKPHLIYFHYLTNVTKKCLPTTGSTCN